MSLPVEQQGVEDLDSLRAGPRTDGVELALDGWITEREQWLESHVETKLLKCQQRTPHEHGGRTRGVARAREARADEEHLHRPRGRSDGVDDARLRQRHDETPSETSVAKL